MPLTPHTLNWLSPSHTIPVVHSGETLLLGTQPGCLKALQWHSVPGGTTPVSPLGQDHVSMVSQVKGPSEQGGPGGEGPTAEQSSRVKSRGVDFGVGEAVVSEARMRVRSAEAAMKRTILIGL